MGAIRRRQLAAWPLALLLVLWIPQAASAALSLGAPFGTAGSAPGQFNGASGVAVDQNGDIYVADTGNSRVEEFAPDHAYLRTIGAPGQLSHPEGVAVDGQGDLFVADTAHDQVVRFAAGSLQATSWGSAGALDGQFSAPAGVTVDADGNVYVADTGNARVQKFTNTGGFLTVWGTSGTGLGQFLSPTGIAASPDGSIYVADTGNDRIEHFLPDGQLISQWGSAGTLDGQFAGPAGVAVSPLGYVYVADTGNQRIERFTLDGAFIDSTGVGGPAGLPGQFDHPTGLAFDPSGNVYVADRDNNQIQTGRDATQTTLASLPPPTVHKTINAEPVNGTVLVRTPAARRFVALLQAAQLPLGTQIDTRSGRVTIASRTTNRAPTETMRFYQGMFRVQQSPGRLPTTMAVLAGGDFSSCNSAGSASTYASTARKRPKRRKRRVIRHLWGSGDGHYSTVGHDGSAAVQDPTWLTEDRCDGTLFVVTNGTIIVHDTERHRFVTLHAPNRYLVPGRPANRAAAAPTTSH
jgi:DNA-binding beta-propeller fold protein YncE